jgi:RNA polymerase sigma factor (sigma-70 family)
MTLDAPPGDDRRRDRYAELRDIFEAASGGDQAAWDELVHRLGGLVWSICRSFRLDQADAADVFQFTWLQLLDHLDTIQDAAKLPGWLATTARRECTAMYRRRHRVVYVGEGATLDQLAGSAGGADVAALARQRDTLLWEAFFMLGTTCQRILWLLVVDPPEGSAYAAASEHLGLPPGSLGPKRGRCLQQLRRHLKTLGYQEVVS